MILNTKSLDILENFLGDYNKKIYGRDLSKRIKMNQKTVSNVLKGLEKERILNFSTEGKNKYYNLNKANPHIKEIIKLVEINKKIKFIEKYKKFRDLFDKIALRIDGVLVVFGSYSNFSANDKSDIDVLIIGKNKQMNDLEDLYGIKINIVKSNVSKFNKDDVFGREIMNKHVILKGVEEFVDTTWQA